MASTVSRKTQERLSGPTIRHSYRMEEATTIIQGTMVALNSAGRAVPASAATGLTIVGIAEQTVANPGADDALRIDVREGTFKLNNAAAADAIARGDIGNGCYATDNDTVSDVATGRSVAGVIVEVDTDLGIWVKMGIDSRVKVTDAT